MRYGFGLFLLPLGRPPFIPLARTAAVLASDFFIPPSRPSIAAALSGVSGTGLGFLVMAQEGYTRTASRSTGTRALRFSTCVPKRFGLYESITERESAMTTATAHPHVRPANRRCPSSGSRRETNMREFMAQKIQCPSCGRLLGFRAATCSSGATLPRHNRPIKKGAA